MVNSHAAITQVCPGTQQHQYDNIHLMSPFHIQTSNIGTTLGHNEAPSIGQIKNDASAARGDLCKVVIVLSSSRDRPDGLYAVCVVIH